MPLIVAIHVLIATIGESWNLLQAIILRRVMSDSLLWLGLAHHHVVGLQEHYLNPGSIFTRLYSNLDVLQLRVVKLVKDLL